MADAAELREKARRLVELAAQTGDIRTRGLLLDIASQYAEMAAREAERAPKPPSDGDG